jgi:hypothetical protein
MFKYYRDLFTESDNLLKDYESNLTKRNYFLEVMNEPLKSSDNTNEEILKVKGFENLSATQPPSNPRENPGNIFDKFVTPSVNEIQMADKLENFIKNTFSKNYKIKIKFRPTEHTMDGLDKILLDIVGITCLFKSHGQE